MAFALNQIADAGIMRRPGTIRFGRLAHTNIEPETQKRIKPANASEANGARLYRKRPPKPRAHVTDARPARISPVRSK